MNTREVAKNLVRKKRKTRIRTTKMRIKQRKKMRKRMKRREMKVTEVRVKMTIVLVQSPMKKGKRNINHLRKCILGIMYNTINNN